MIQTGQVICTESHGEEGAEFIGAWTQVSWFFFRAPHVQNCAKTCGGHKRRTTPGACTAGGRQKAPSLHVCHSFWCESGVAAMSVWEAQNGGKMQTEGHEDIWETAVMPLNMLNLWCLSLCEYAWNRGQMGGWALREPNKWRPSSPPKFRINWEIDLGIRQLETNDHPY